MSYKNINRAFFLLLFVFSYSIQSFGQNSQTLARHYYVNGEYEKAAEMYKKIYIEKQYAENYFSYYYQSLVNAELYKEALKAIEEHNKKRPGSAYTYFLEGRVHELLGENKKAEKLYDKAIITSKGQFNNSLKVGSSFIQLSKYDSALKVYQNSLEVASEQNKATLYYRIAQLYNYTGDEEKKLEYLSAYFRQMKGVNVSNYMKSNLKKILTDQEIEKVKNNLLEDIQKDPDNQSLLDMLVWCYMQLGMYQQAYRQLVAIDKRYNKQGKEVYTFAVDARKSENYKISAKAFKYIVDEKDKKSPYYYVSLTNYLDLQGIILEKDTTTTKEDYLGLQKEYESFIKELGVRNRTSNLILDLAKLKALRILDVDGAISTLQELLDNRYVDSSNKARAKLLLGDFYLLKDEVWEASLLFSQVDKKFKEGELGQQARYKNAKLHYYMGDFNWAQIIFDILKPATSKLISNDAIETSVFITETVGEDSTMVEPLQKYANAELLMYQNRYDEAISLMDSINFLFPSNKLEDDIWYKKAQIFKSLKKYDLSVQMYQQVIDKYPEELRADNALFELADLYETVLDDKDKALELYKKIFVDYSNSTFAIEARKKYRELSEKE